MRLARLIGTVLAAGALWSAAPAAASTPFDGQGMNSGIRDAQNLAWKLAAVVERRLGPGVLAEYQRERADHVWQMVRLALRMGRVMAPRSRLHGLLTRGAFRTLAVWPPARDYVAQMKYKPKPRFAAGFLVPDGKGVRATLVGRLLPQPRIALTDGREILLDELLGNRFTLLLRGAVTKAELAALYDPVLERIGAVTVLLTPRGTRSPAPAGVATAVELDGALDAAMRDYAGQALLLRPDHYVAAAIPLAAPAQAMAAIRALVENTWAGVPREPA